MNPLWSRRFSLLAGAFVLALPLGLVGCPDEPVDESGDESSDAGECTAGTINCECLQGQCINDLSCINGICVEEECTPGALGCECVDGSCLGTNLCMDGVCVDPNGDGDGDPHGDGDGDPSGDGDGDPSGDGDGDPSGDGDGDGDPSGDGDGDGDANTCGAPNGAFGCEFQSVKLPVQTNGYWDDWSLRIVVGNPGPDDASIEVETRTGGQWSLQAGPVPVPAGQLHTFYFYGPSDVVPNGHEDGYAYRIRSTTPVVAHQYNVGYGATNLLPSRKWGYDYSALDFGYYDCFVVVASVDNTTVQIDPSAMILAGPDVPATSQPFQVLMNAGDTIGVYAASPGTFSARITSDPSHPIGVFSGSWSGGGSSHAQEQLLPRSLAATDYLGITAPSSANGNYHRIFALAAATVTVESTDPPVEFPINADSVATVQKNNIAIHSTEPTVVYSWPSFDGQNNGPMVALMVPNEQLATRYGIPIISYQPSLPVQVTVAYPVGSTHSFNGQMPLPLAPQYEFAAGWLLARYQLEPGMYVLESAEPVAAMIGQNQWSLNAGVRP